LTVDASTVFRKQLEVWIERESSIFFRVKIWTMQFLTFAILFTRMNFVVSRMILLFFPAMTKFASIFVLAAIGIRSNEVFNLPICAKLFSVVVNMRLSSKILPVVSIDAVFLVVIMAPRTPNSFKEEHIEISV
jgi:hypothetical protein